MMRVEECPNNIQIRLEISTVINTTNAIEEPNTETQKINTIPPKVATYPSGSASISAKSGTKGKICKHTWRGTTCDIPNCQNIHIDPCQDRECRALDDSLPLYKSRNCQIWHVKTKPKSTPRVNKTQKTMELFS